MNVIVIACNGLHLGFLGHYGNGWIETPHLDRLAAEGVVFDHHFPENLTTLPTRRSWWTGRYGFTDPELGWTPLRHDEPILPDLLQPSGVRTALISDNPWLRLPEHGYGRGFDDVSWIRGSGYDAWIPASDLRAAGVRLSDQAGFRLPPPDDPNYEQWVGRWEQYLRNRAALPHDRVENTGVARTVDSALEWLRRQARDASPFLLWLDLFSPHGPWDPPQPFRDRYAAFEPDEFEAGEEGDLIEEEEDFDDPGLEDVRILIDTPAGPVGDVLSEEELLRIRRTYAGCVSLLDDRIGALMQGLKGLGRLEDTLIIFTADQGEPLGEHGYVRRYLPWLHEELVHTPLVIRLPGAQRGGRRHRALVQTVDLFPTILSWLNLPIPEETHGQDLLPLIRGESTKVRDYACMGMDVEEFAIRTTLWHYILPVAADPEDPPRAPQLYRKPEDRWEQNDVAEQNPEVADQLELVLRRFADELRRGGDLRDLPGLRDVARFTTH
ncbi:MAG: sulfatase [Isosphaeraceae bacterium]